VQAIGCTSAASKTPVELLNAIFGDKIDLPRVVHIGQDRAVRIGRTFSRVFAIGSSASGIPGHSRLSFDLRRAPTAEEIWKEPYENTALPDRPTSAGSFNR